VRRENEFALVGYVLMPEHVHLLLGEPAKGTPSTVLQMLSKRVSRKLRKKTTDRHTNKLPYPLRKLPRTIRGFGKHGLRFQRLQRRQETREARLHALQSGYS